MNKIRKIISGIIIFIIARVLSIFMYDKKYLKSKWFSSKHGRVFAQGWTWVWRDFIGRVLFRKNIGVRFPISPNVTITQPNNISFHPDTLNNFQSYGNYYQMMLESKISIGEGTWIASNVGFITTNHNVYNLEEHIESKDIVIGKDCWIGMNSVILPGVKLGDNTIVGAGSVVTKSQESGNCIIAGNPAKVIRQL